MQVHFNQLRRQRFFQVGGVLTSQQQHTLVIESAHRLLWQLQCLELSAIDELNPCEDGLELRLSLEGNIFAADEADLQRIQLFPQKVGQQPSLRLYLNL